jgi:hypothetical protein
MQYAGKRAGFGPDPLLRVIWVTWRILRERRISRSGRRLEIEAGLPAADRRSVSKT